MTWSVLAASTATSAAAWSVKRLASLAAGSTWKETVEPAFKKSGLDHELAGAYEAAFKGFVDVLGGPFAIDDLMDARLREMFADDGFQEILTELPRARFEEVDTSHARELFAGLGLPGAGDAHFDFAWATFGRAFRDRIAQTTHAAQLAELSTQDRIESYLAEIAAAVRPRDESATLVAYRRYVEDLYRLADTRGLFWREKETTGEEIHLTDVFVETQLQRRYPVRAKARKQKDDDRRQLEDEEERSGDERDLGARRAIERETREEPRAVADVLAKERRLVILGPPGSGKSTLVRCLALAQSAAANSRRPMATGLADETVPIVLLLKTYAARLKLDSSLKLDVFLLDEVGSQLPNIEEVLKSGSALILLDGLDEVFDEDHRRWVSAEVERVMSRFPRARFVLTSRPHGYHAAPLSGAVPLFEMVPFDEERIRAFFRGWFAALARQGLETERGQTPEQRADALADDVLERERIRSLAESPMLCTLIVLVHRSRSGRLPERRVKFYEAAVAVLTEHWEREKRSPKQETPLEFPEPELMVGVLAEVAWRAQTELEGREIQADCLEGWILQALADDPEWSGRRERASRDLLQVIQGRTGLLVDAGGDHYQFVHLSLQEYLVAFYLLDRLEGEPCARVVRHFLHVPEWEEILRLTMGDASRVRADALIRAVLMEPTSEWEATLLRDLRFVCRSLSDRPNVSETVRGKARSRWLEGLTSRSHEDEAALILDGLGLGLTEETRTAVGGRLSDDDFRVRLSAVDYFAKIGADDASTRTAVAGRLSDDDEDVRRSAVGYFAKICDDDASTRTAFEGLLSDDDFRVRLSAVDYFAEIGADDVSTRTAVAGLLSDDDFRVRRSAVDYFAKRGADDASTRTAFEGLLSDDGEDVRRSAVDYFAKIGADDASTRTAVAGLLSDDYVSVRLSAVDYFVQIGADDASTRATVAGLLSDADFRVRRSVVDYFARIGADDASTRIAVEVCLSDDFISVRLSAVDYFAKIGADDASTRTAVARLLSDDYSRVRLSVVDYFAKVGADDASTRTAFDGLLSDDDFRVRLSAVDYFAKIGADDASTRTAVGGRLSDDDFRVRLSAVDYFAKIGADDASTRTTFEGLLSDRKLRAAAITFFIETGLRGYEMVVLDTFASGASSSTSTETDQKLSTAIGRLAAEDDALLKRITEEPIQHLQLSRALAAAAERRDELRREKISLDEVLAGREGGSA